MNLVRLTKITKYFLPYSKNRVYRLIKIAYERQTITIQNKKCKFAFNIGVENQ
jgi:hypothetical protein